MADHSQKWHDGTTSRNIKSSSSKDRLAALVNKLDNLGKDIKKLKESVYVIQVGCQICEGPHLDRDCPLTKEVKQVEEVRYGEFGQTAPKENSKQAKVVTVENEGPSSPKKLKNLHEISFLSDSQEENTIDQLPTKESNPGHFMLPSTIANFNFYAIADLGASVNVLPRNIFEYLGLRNLSETEMLVEMADMRKKHHLG
ncbi:zinc knuckle CX2CX4HX4C containing protein [Tanacetum coccineum]